MHLIPLLATTLVTIIPSLVFSQPPPTTTTSLVASPSPSATPAPAQGNSTTPAVPAGATCGTQNTWSEATTLQQLTALLPANCTTFLGSLKVSGPGISDLTPLNKLQSVQLSLDIAGTGIKDLKGLGALRSVGENFYVHDNPTLANLFGLDSLATVEGGILIYQNPQLVSLAGLATLRSINPTNSPKYAFGISVYANPMLSSLEGLENLSSVGNVLMVGNMTRLTTLEGLPKASGGGKGFAVQEIRLERLPLVKALAPLAGFTSIAAVNATLPPTTNGTTNTTTPSVVQQQGTALTVTLMDSLPTLSGLVLPQISTLTITHNAALSDISAIYTSVVASTLTIDDNSKLCEFGPLGSKQGVVNTCGKPQQVVGGTGSGGSGQGGDFPGGPNMALPGENGVGKREVRVLGVVVLLSAVGAVVGGMV